jgi:UDPglucose 6-dehydrogenase
VDMPLLRAVVETNDKLAEIVDHEVDAAGNAATHAQLREAATTGGQRHGRSEPA